MKSSGMQLKSLSVSMLFLMIVLLLGCYEQREGCLDALASNFQIDSDIGCGDCCEYPQLTFTVKHLYDTLNFNLGSVYSNGLGQTFIPRSITFYVSDVTLKQGDDWLAVDESILINNGQTNIEQPDDVAVISRSGFEFGIGDFLKAGNYTGLRFSIGLNAPEFTGGQQTEYEDSNHPLDTVDNELWSDAESYLMYDLDILVDSAVLDTVTYTAVAAPSLAIELAIDVFKVRGEKLSIPLAINYQRWFQDIDFGGDSTEVIRQKIMAGIKNSISVVE